MKTAKLEFQVTLFQKGDRVQTAKGMATVMRNELEPIQVEDAVNGEILVRLDAINIYMMPEEMDEILIKKSEVRYIYNEVAKGYT